MKATFTMLAALLVSALTWSTASAQYPGYEMPAGHAVVSAPAAGGPVYSSAGGSCATGDCGKHGWFNKLGGHKLGCGAGGCGAKGCGLGANGCNGGFCAGLKSWLCRPLPSNAPRFGKPEYPLGFPTHPYLRSPRDYFMMD